MLDCWFLDWRISKKVHLYIYALNEKPGKDYNKNNAARGILRLGEVA